MSLAFLGSGSFLLLFYLNVILKDVAGERHWALPLLGGVAIVIGLFCLLSAIVEGLSRTLSPGTVDRIRFVLNFGLAVVAITTLAAGLLVGRRCRMASRVRRWCAIQRWNYRFDLRAPHRLDAGCRGC